MYDYSCPTVSQLLVTDFPPTLIGIPKVNGEASTKGQSENTLIWRQKIVILIFFHKTSFCAWDWYKITTRVKANVIIIFFFSNFIRHFYRSFLFPLWICVMCLVVHSASTNLELKWILISERLKNLVFLVLSFKRIVFLKNEIEK